jgi:hypothetical protein
LSGGVRGLGYAAFSGVLHLMDMYELKPKVERIEHGMAELREFL